MLSARPSRPGPKAEIKDIHSEAQHAHPHQHQLWYKQPGERGGLQKIAEGA